MPLRARHGEPYAREVFRSTREAGIYAAASRLSIAGGRSHYRFSGPPVANSVTRVTGTYGVLSLDLHATGYRFEFVPEPGKSFSDAGAGSCH